MQIETEKIPHAVPNSDNDNKVRFRAHNMFQCLYISKDIRQGMVPCRTLPPHASRPCIFGSFVRGVCHRHPAQCVSSIKSVLHDMCVQKWIGYTPMHLLVIAVAVYRIGLHSCSQFASDTAHFK